jgi:Asp-tRNA(Asn)/Glu-tRNA(Gln) amidotransferase A subunit family amidase
MNAALAKDLDLELHEETVREHVANALQILEQPDAEIDELDLEAVRHRLRRALAAAEREAWSDMESIGLHLHADLRAEPGKSVYRIEHRYARTILTTSDQHKAMQLLKELRAVELLKYGRKDSPC